MASQTAYSIGVLFSLSGGYVQPARQGYRGAVAAIDHVNRSPDFPFTLLAHHADPGGEADRYAPLCRELIGRHGVRNVVGCTTSWSRKEVIPVVEKADALLWYPCVYEGFEVSENLVYVAACANQHLVPLIDYVAPRFGSRVLLLGSNYIWGWEMNRIARDILHRSGGEVLGERYVPIGDTDIEHLIDEVREKRPDFILNNLIGPSSYAFLRALHRLGGEDRAFSAAGCPVLSCNLYENEIAMLGEAAAGHFTVGCYFNRLDTPRNHAFLGALDAAGSTAVADAFFVQSYSSVLMIAEAIRRTGSDRTDAMLDMLRRTPLETPLGTMKVDRWTHHFAMPAHIGRARADGTFDIVHRAVETIAPDPFLTSTPLSRPLERAEARAELRVVK